MKTRKSTIMRNGVLVAVLLVVATLVMGCSNSADGDSGSGGGGASGGSGGTVALPANLKNTTWKNEKDSNRTFMFKEFTIEQKYGGSPGIGYGVFAAAENGKIVVKMGVESVWQHQDEETFCDSYSISGDKLTLTGGNKLYAGTYTKVN